MTTSAPTLVSDSATIRVIGSYDQGTWVYDTLQLPHGISELELTKSLAKAQLNLAHIAGESLQGILFVTPEGIFAEEYVFYSLSETFDAVRESAPHIAVLEQLEDFFENASIDNLTDDEIEVNDVNSTGMSNSAIADMLYEHAARIIEQRDEEGTLTQTEAYQCCLLADVLLRTEA